MDITMEAALLGVREQTARNWRNGTTRRPPYYDQALGALRVDLQPASPALTCAMWSSLGVSKQVAAYWRKTGQVPKPARLATSYINYRKVIPA